MRIRYRLLKKAFHYSVVSCLCLIIHIPHSKAGVTLDYPIVKLRSLDKISARTTIFEARVGSTVQFGQVYIKIQACRKAPEMEQPESAAFLQVWEIQPEKKQGEKEAPKKDGPKNDKAAWIFSGWLFASSPGLSSMDHPLYDVWVLDCLAENPPASQPEAPTQTAE